METWSIMEFHFRYGLILRRREAPSRRMARMYSPSFETHRFAMLLRMRPSGRRTRLDELVDDGIHQRLERGIDDIGRHADRGPMLAGLVFALDQHPRHGFSARVENTDAVVGQLQPLDELLVLAEVLAQRHVERIDRTVA